MYDTQEHAWQTIVWAAPQSVFGSRLRASTSMHLKAIVSPARELLQIRVGGAADVVVRLVSVRDMYLPGLVLAWQAAGSDCPFKMELDNCGKFDIYTMETPRCVDIGCSTLATGLWFFSLLSLGLTIAWTAAFYTRAMKNRLVLQKQLWRWRACAFMTTLGILMFII